VFWTDATVERADRGFTVRLDGHPIKTPAKADFVMPTRALAAAAAVEWQAQETHVDPKTMPVTRAVNAAIDKVAVQRDEIVAMLAAYGDADLLCYRADSPAGLVARQAAAWDPLLAWAETRLGARLAPVTGVMHQSQAPEALARLKQPLDVLTAFELTAVHDLISLTGSLVIGLAASTGQGALQSLWDASRIDETWQAEHWGEDQEAAEEADLKRAAFFQAAKFLALVRSENLSKDA